MWIIWDMGWRGLIFVPKLYGGKGTQTRPQTGKRNNGIATSELKGGAQLWHGNNLWPIKRTLMRKLTETSSLLSQ